MFALSVSESPVHLFGHLERDREKREVKSHKNSHSHTGLQTHSSHALKGKFQRIPTNSLVVRGDRMLLVGKKEQGNSDFIDRMTKQQLKLTSGRKETSCQCSMKWSKRAMDLNEPQFPFNTLLHAFSQPPIHSPLHTHVIHTQLFFFLWGGVGAASCLLKTPRQSN